MSKRPDGTESIPRYRPQTVRADSEKIGEVAERKRSPLESGGRLTERGQSADYEIGKGKPPRQYTWKRRQSGNPGGRPKGSKNLKTIVKKAARRTVTVTKGGRARKMTVTEVGIHALHQAVLQGDRKAFLVWIALIERYCGGDDSNTSMKELLAEDRELLAEFLARNARKKRDPESDT